VQIYNLLPLDFAVHMYQFWPKLVDMVLCLELSEVKSYCDARNRRTGAVGTTIDPERWLNSLIPSQQNGPTMPLPASES
jgi:hypothetical protein